MDGQALEPVPTPPDASLPGATERARELLRAGPALVDAVGRDLATDLDQALATMEQAGEGARRLMAINDELLPLLLRMKSRGGARWWRWFTGETLEKQVLVECFGGRVAPLVAQGVGLHASLARQGLLLRAERQRMAHHVQWLRIEAQAARLLCDRSWAEPCRTAGLDGDDLARLARRAANLDTLAVALQLNRSQLKLVIASAHATSDRFAEIRTVLLPLWKQSLGLRATVPGPAIPPPTSIGGPS